MADWIETRFGRLLQFGSAWLLECPGCGERAYLDDDQLHGRISVDHTPTGCAYHETHDFADELGV